MRRPSGARRAPKFLGGTAARAMLRIVVKLSTNDSTQCMLPTAGMSFTDHTYSTRAVSVQHYDDHVIVAVCYLHHGVLYYWHVMYSVLGYNV